MGKAAVVCSGKHHLGHPKLFDATKALELASVDESKKQAVLIRLFKWNHVVDRISNNGWHLWRQHVDFPDATEPALLSALTSSLSDDATQPWAQAIRLDSRIACAHGKFKPHL